MDSRTSGAARAVRGRAVLLQQRPGQAAGRTAAQPGGYYLTLTLTLTWVGPFPNPNPNPNPGITFETKLGNMLAKADRVKSLVSSVGALIGTGPGDMEVAAEAALVR